MKSFLTRLHARVGDLWWYSAMIFLACRSGDAIQAFIGLWLIPKYVGPQELGAVMPLQQLTSFLTVPLGIVAVVFAKYVNTYATRGEYGKVKSFIRDVFSVSFILFIICIAGAYLIMPFFYERLRISSGSLTFLILLCGLVANIGAIIGAAQQGLKRFKTMSVMTFLGAPIRLITLLVAMPFRPLSGYILGQTTPGATTSILSFFDIHRALKPYSPDTAWRKDWKKILVYAWPIILTTWFGALISTSLVTIYRQRLPEIESAAYYMMTRFTDITTFLGSSISVVLFPLAAEAHESGNEDNSILKKAITATAISSILSAIALYFIAKPIFSINSTWSTYNEFSYLLPYLAIATGMGTIIGNITTFEIACRRFKICFVTTIANLIWISILISFTGHEFFLGKVPESVISFMRHCNLSNLKNMTFGTIISATFQLVMIYGIFHQRQQSKTTSR